MASKRLEKFLLKWDTRKKQWVDSSSGAVAKSKENPLWRAWDFTLLLFVHLQFHPSTQDLLNLLFLSLSLALSLSLTLGSSFRFVLCLIHQARCRRSRQKSKLKKFNLLQVICQSQSQIKFHIGIWESVSLRRRHWQLVNSLYAPADVEPSVESTDAPTDWRKRNKSTEKRSESHW